MRDYTDSFITVMEMASLKYGFESTFGEDQELVNYTYKNYIKELKK
jgi:hypothetical protein